MLRAFVLAALVLPSAACVVTPLARCGRRDFTPAATEDAEKALAERVGAAKARGFERWVARKRLDPDFPSEPERLAAEKRRLNADKCYEYGYYEEAMSEYELAAEALSKSADAPGMSLKN